MRRYKVYSAVGTASAAANPLGDFLQMGEVTGEVSGFGIRVFLVRGDGSIMYAPMTSVRLVEDTGIDADTQAMIDVINERAGKKIDFNRRADGDDNSEYEQKKAAAGKKAGK